MTDMESLDRAVEEARAAVLNALRAGRTLKSVQAVYSFEAAVSERARAEERERRVAVPPCPHPKSEIYWVDDNRSICAMCGVDHGAEGVRARSSEEAGNGG